MIRFRPGVGQIEPIVSLSLREYWESTTSFPPIHFVFTAWKVAGRRRPWELRSNHEVYSVSSDPENPFQGILKTRPVPQEDDLEFPAPSPCFLGGRLGTIKASYEVWCQHLSPRYHSRTPGPENKSRRCQYSLAETTQSLSQWTDSSHGSYSTYIMLTEG